MLQIYPWLLCIYAYVNVCTHKCIQGMCTINVTDVDMIAIYVCISNVWATQRCTQGGAVYLQAALKGMSQTVVGVVFSCFELVFFLSAPIFGTFVRDLFLVYLFCLLIVYLVLFDVLCDISACFFNDFSKGYLPLLFNILRSNVPLFY